MTFSSLLSPPPTPRPISSFSPDLLCSVAVSLCASHRSPLLSVQASDTCTHKYISAVYIYILHSPSFSFFSALFEAAFPTARDKTIVILQPTSVFLLPSVPLFFSIYNFLICLCFRLSKRPSWVCLKSVKSPVIHHPSPPSCDISLSTP